MPEKSTEDLTPLTLQSVIEVVGADRFHEACRQAMANSDGLLSDVAHDLQDRLWWQGDESVGDRVTVTLELYERMPCYANLMYMNMNWPTEQFDESIWDRLWSGYRRFLGDERRAVADPVEYSLWVDWFEDASTVGRAWRGVSGPDEPRRPRLDRVVSSSGPVPWQLKESLYVELAAEGGWDGPVFQGLYGSCFDVYGSLEREPALRILRSLQIPESRELELLTRALEDPKLSSKATDRRRAASSR